MIAGKAAGLIDDLAAHAERSAVRHELPLAPSRDAQQVYGPAVENYIRLESTLNQFFTAA